MEVDLDAIEKLTRAAAATWYSTNTACAAYIAAMSPEVTLELIARLRAAESIVRDLADCDDPRDGEYGDCRLCGAEATAISHADSCPYRRAQESVK